MRYHFDSNTLCLLCRTKIHFKSCGSLEAPCQTAEVEPNEGLANHTLLTTPLYFRCVGVCGGNQVGQIRMNPRSRTGVAMSCRALFCQISTGRMYFGATESGLATSYSLKMLLMGSGALYAQLGVT